MSVLDFLTYVYLPAREAAGHGPDDRHVREFVALVTKAALAWRDIPPVGKLTAAEIQRVFDGRTGIIKALLDLLRQAIYRGVNRPDALGAEPPRGKMTREEQEAYFNPPAPTRTWDAGPEGTLWHYCVTRYFRLNVRIRSWHTQHQYRIALGELSRVVGHPATKDDLTDDNVALVMRELMEKNLNPNTINSRRDRINALWTWMAKRGEIPRWPANQAVIEPQRTPQAWTRHELDALFNAAALEKGMLKGVVPKWLYWQALLSLCWDTGERVGALLQCRWEHLNLETRWLRVPAEIRKGSKKDKAYLLSGETVGLLRMMRNRSPVLLIPAVYNRLYLWKAFERILKSAGLPTNRQCKFHRIRRSVASHFAAAGGDPQALLGHSSAVITEGYLDPEICKPPQPTDRLAPLGSSGVRHA
jgi:integrase